MKRRHADEKIDWLKSKPWWSELDKDELRLLAEVGDRVTIRAGRDLFHEGDTAMEAAVVIEGELEVKHGDEHVATLGPGEVVGELGVIDHAKRNADVVATVDTELLVLHSTGVRRSIEDSQHLREFVMQAAARHRGTPEPSA